MAFCYSIANIYANKHRYWLQKVFDFKTQKRHFAKAKCSF